jgi:hypothetical protein
MQVALNGVLRDQAMGTRKAGQIERIGRRVRDRGEEWTTVRGGLGWVVTLMRRSRHSGCTGWTCINASKPIAVSGRGSRGVESERVS